MRAGERFGAIAAGAVRRARLLLALSALVAVAAGLAATRLPTDAGADTLVDRDSSAYQASELVRQRFGEDPVVVLARGDLRTLLLTKNLGQLLRLEGCLAGAPPKNAKPIPGPCAGIAKLHPVEFLSGPATFLNQAVIGIDQQLGRRFAAARARAKRLALAVARQARQQGYSTAQAQALGGRAASGVIQDLERQLLKTAATYGITSLPRLTDRNFISRVVFDLRQTGGTPKAKLAYLFPNRDAAQIVLRLRPDLSDSERHRALALIDEAVHDTTPRQVCADGKHPAPCFALDGGSYVVSGAPVVIDGLAGVLENALLVLFAAALVVMALTLLLVFRSRLRLLPLGLALAAAGITFGLLGLAGGSLTMASIAVLPVLIGLAVDYAIQLQARYDEAVESGIRGADAARAAAVRGGPVIGTACLATAAGFAALQLSPSPMVRGFGLMLVVGIAVAFGLALTAGFAALSLRREGAGPSRPMMAPIAAARRPLGRWGRSALAVAIASPGRVLIAGLVLALCGWVAGTRTETISDVRELVPQDLAQVRDLNRAAERHRGLGGARRQHPDHGHRRPRPDQVDGAVQAAGARRQWLRRALSELPQGPDLSRPRALGLPRPARARESRAPGSGS